MAFYKVYAECVRKPLGEAVKEISAADAAFLINESLEMNNELHRCEPDTEDAYCLAVAVLSRDGIFECGDFAIVSSDSAPSRGNIYGYTCVV